MKVLTDLVGLRFSRWSVIAEAGRGRPANGSPVGARNLYCVCDCGVQKTINYGSLTRGGTKSCGCLRAETSAAKSFTHGKSKSPEYQAWSHAKNRCYVPTDPRYPRYGARGIGMCATWRASFEAFLSDVGGYLGAQAARFSFRSVTEDGMNPVEVNHAGCSTLRMAHSAASCLDCAVLNFRMGRQEGLGAAEITGVGGGAGVV